MFEIESTTMAPSNTTARSVSQEAFNELVPSDDLGMEPSEALQDTIETLTLQGVDLSGIMTSVLGESNPVIECLENMKRLESETNALDDETVEVFDKLTKLCGDTGNGNASIASKNGGVQLVCSFCSKLTSGVGFHRALLSALNALTYNS